MRRRVPGALCFLSHCTIDTRIDTCALHKLVFNQSRVPENGISHDPQHLNCSKLINGSGASVEGLVLCGLSANDVPWSARKVLQELKNGGIAADPRWHE